MSHQDLAPKSLSINGFVQRGGSPQGRRRSSPSWRMRMRTSSACKRCTARIRYVLCVHDVFTMFSLNVFYVKKLGLLMDSPNFWLLKNMVIINWEILGPCPWPGQNLCQLLPRSRKLHLSEDDESRPTWLWITYKNTSYLVGFEHIHLIILTQLFWCEQKRGTPWVLTHCHMAGIWVSTFQPCSIRNRGFLLLWSCHGVLKLSRVWSFGRRQEHVLRYRCLHDRRFLVPMIATDRISCVQPDNLKFQWFL